MNYSTNEMKRNKKLIFLSIALIFFLFIIPGITHIILQAQAEAIIVQKVEKTIESAQEYESNVIRIEFNDDVPKGEIEKLLGETNIPTIFKGTPYEKVRYITVEEGEMLEKMVEYTKKDIVRSVDVNHIFTHSAWETDGESRALPIDWDASKHWYFDKIKLPEIWEKQGCLESSDNCGGSNEIVVAVLDTGLGLNSTITNFSYNSNSYGPINHGIAPEMEDINLWVNPDGENANNGFCNDIHGVDIAIAYENRNLYSNDNPCNSNQFYKEGQPNDDYGHGTFVSGIVASATNNALNTSVSISHNVSILTIKANIPFESSFTGRAIEEGIYYAAEYADVLNMSIGSSTGISYLEPAINYAVSEGVVVISASGNQNTSVSYPAAYPNSIAVGAVNSDNSRSSYSNYGPELDFVAPVGQGSTAGNAMWHETLSCMSNCDSGSDFTTYSHQYGIGTSYASPQVAAAAALIKTFDQTLTHSQVKNILIATVDDLGDSNEKGYGLLNLENIYNSFHTVEYISGEGGEIIGEVVQNIFDGENGTEVTAVANTGYVFDQWSDGIQTANRTDTNVTEDITVTAYFNQAEYSLTYNAGSGGSITGNTNQTVEHGQDGSEVTAVADTGYVFDQWNDGVTTASRTDTNVTENINVTASFIPDEENLYTLTYTHTIGGNIEGYSLQIVPKGEDGTEVTAIPNTGYIFLEWSDGLKTAIRTDTNVNKKIIVEARFAFLIYVDENFNQDTLGWGETHFNNINTAIDSCPYNAICKYNLSDVQDILLDTTDSSEYRSSIPFNTKQVFELDNGLEITFPEGVEIIGPFTWDNNLLLPKYLDNPTLDLNYIVSKIIKLGNYDTSLYFSKPIRLLIPQEAGKNVGYISPDNLEFNKIQNTCEQDDEIITTEEIFDCKINIGEDLVIWSNHLTEFITYEDIPESSPTENPEEENQNEEDIDDEKTTTSLPQTGMRIITVFSLALITFIMFFLKTKRKKHFTNH